MTFKGKAKWFYSETSCIELIAIYVHPKNSNHIRSQSRAIMALDHSRLGLKNKFLKKKSGQVRCLTGLLYKILPTNLGLCKPTFYTFYAAHLRWSSTIYHTDLTQNTVFHNFSRQIFRTINRGLNQRNQLKNF